MNLYFNKMLCIALHRKRFLTFLFLCLASFCQADLLATNSLRATRLLCTELIARLSARDRDLVALDEMLRSPFIHPLEQRLINHNRSSRDTLFLENHDH